MLQLQPPPGGPARAPAHAPCLLKGGSRQGARLGLGGRPQQGAVQACSCGRADGGGTWARAHRPASPSPYAAVGLSCIVGLGAVSPGPAFSSMMTKFGLASICGYQVGSPSFSTASSWLLPGFALLVCGWMACDRQQALAAAAARPLCTRPTLAAACTPSPCRPCGASPPRCTAPSCLSPTPSLVSGWAVGGWGRWVEGKGHQGRCCSRDKHMPDRAASCSSLHALLPPVPQA